MAAVADFMQLEPPADAALLQMVEERASLRFMQQHAQQFDEKLSKIARNAACGLPPTAGPSQPKHKAPASALVASHLSVLRRSVCLDLGRS